jgi:hypothetical protein
MKRILRALRRAAILCTLLLLPAAGFAGFFISNGQLLDNNGTPFVMRGVNYPYTWFQSRNTQQDLAAIAAHGLEHGARGALHRRPVGARERHAGVADHPVVQGPEDDRGAGGA